jgi:hypothetical protein
MNFAGITSIKFNGTAAASWSRVSATLVNTTVSTGATTGKITLTTAGGTATSSASFAVP